MNESENKSGLEKKIGVVTELVKAVPIYQDLAQPAAQEVGKALGTVAKLVNIALAPVSGLVWGYDKIASWLEIKLSEKLKNIPPDDIITPPINIAGPVIEAMRFTGQNDELREMYANLLASSMNKETTDQTHPRFIEVIKNLSIEEAKILSLLSEVEVPSIIKNITKFGNFYNCSNKFLHKLLDLDKIKLDICIDNLITIGLLTAENNFQNELTRKTLESNPILKRMESLKLNHFGTLGNVNIFLTSFGLSFINSVVKNK